MEKKLETKIRYPVDHQQETHALRSTGFHSSGVVTWRRAHFDASFARWCSQHCDADSTSLRLGLHESRTKLADSIHWFEGLNTTPSLVGARYWRESPCSRLHLLSTPVYGEECVGDTHDLPSTTRAHSVNSPSFYVTCRTQCASSPRCCEKQQTSRGVRSSGAIIKPSPTRVVVVYVCPVHRRNHQMGSALSPSNFGLVFLHATVCLLLLLCQSVYCQMSLFDQNG